MVKAARKLAIAAVLVLAVALGAGPAQANDHDKGESGHPLRVAAYLLYPVGLLIDTLIFRPAHWFVNHQPFRTIFGHDED